MIYVVKKVFTSSISIANLIIPTMSNISHLNLGPTLMSNCMVIITT